VPPAVSRFYCGASVSKPCCPDGFEDWAAGCFLKLMPLRDRFCPRMTAAKRFGYNANDDVALTINQKTRRFNMACRRGLAKVVAQRRISSSALSSSNKKSSCSRSFAKRQKLGVIADVVMLLVYAVAEHDENRLILPNIDINPQSRRH
jgi:hypothetical protein